MNFMVSLDSQEENTGKYITFSVSISKNLDNGKTVTQKLKFVDSFRFMSTSVSSLVDNLSEIYEKECKGCKKAKSFQMYASMSILDISKTLMLEF